MQAAAVPPPAASPRPAGSTLDVVDDPGRHRRARVVRRVVMGAVVAFVAAGALGAFGSNGATARARSGPWTLRVDYPSRTRSGLAVGLRVVVAHEEALPATVTVRMEQRYLDVFDVNAMSPEPEGASSRAGSVEFEVAPSEGADRVELVFDARAQPDARGTRASTVEVLDGGEVVARVHIETVFFP